MELHHVVLMVFISVTAIHHVTNVPTGCLTSEECCDNLSYVNGECSNPCLVIGVGGSNPQYRVARHTVAYIPAVIEPRIPPPVKPDCTLECSGDDQCPPGRACVDHHCVDPCSGKCGANSTCRVVNHTPNCECLPGHTGNPFDGCRHQPDSHCNKSWLPVATGVKKFKAYTTKKVDWLEALMQCTRKGSRLATVMNQQELDEIKKAINLKNIRGGNFWIAGTDHLHNKEWFWFTTDAMVRIGEFRDWMKGQPDSDGEDCLEYWEANQKEGYKWNDRPCHEHHFYICEYFQ